MPEITFGEGVNDIVEKGKFWKEKENFEGRFEVS